MAVQSQHGRAGELALAMQAISTGGSNIRASSGVTKQVFAYLAGAESKIYLSLVSDDFCPNSFQYSRHCYDYDRDDY